jgi:hypothetical protein
MIPCEECLVFPICKSRKEIKCEKLYKYICKTTTDDGRCNITGFNFNGEYFDGYKHNERALEVETMFNISIECTHISDYTIRAGRPL